MSKFAQILDETFTNCDFVSAIFRVPGVIAILVGFICFICLFVTLFKKD